MEFADIKLNFGGTAEWFAKKFPGFYSDECYFILADFYNKRCQEIVDEKTNKNNKRKIDEVEDPEQQPTTENRGVEESKGENNGTYTELISDQREHSTVFTGTVEGDNTLTDV